MNRLRVLLAALAALTACASDGPRVDSESAVRPPNFVLIVADDLGWGDLGCFGQKKISTPRLDRMAAEGMRLTNFYAGSTVCAPSRCVLMTGLHTGHCLVRGNARLALRPHDETVAEMLKARGYATGLIGKWGLGEQGSSGVPTKQGFDSFFGYLNQRHAHNYYPTFLYRDEQRVALRNVMLEQDAVGAGVATERVEYSHDLFATEALEFVRTHRAQPFFLFLALTIPHANNEAGKKGMEVPDYGAYAGRDWPEAQKGHAAMISRMDRDVGRILDELRALELAEDTLVIFTSDNGPHREGGNDPDFADSNGKLRGIKRALFDGGIRVPTIAWWPTKIAAGSESAHVAYFGDVFATAAELAGAAVKRELDSVSFLPTLTGRGAQAAHDALYWEFYERGSAQAVRSGRWKAIRKPMFTGRIQLYDIENDMGERRDLAREHPEVRDRMAEIMEREHEPSPHWSVRPRRRGRSGR